MRTYPPLEERIAAKTDRSAGPDACWPWLGGRGGKGSPGTSLGGRLISARRAVWDLGGEPAPENRQVFMTCGNQACVNRKHMVLKPFKDTVALFWSHVQKGDGCWEWTGARSQREYGQFKIGGRGSPNVPASRYSWELHHGPIPDDLFACHHCDNPECVRPDHLFLGTAADNAADKTAKGRQARGLALSHAMKAAVARAKAAGKTWGRPKKLRINAASPRRTDATEKET